MVTFGYCGRKIPTPFGSSVLLGIGNRSGGNSWWSKKKIGVVLLIFLVIGLIHLYFSSGSARFEVVGLEVEPKVTEPDQAVTVECIVRNTGDSKGTQTLSLVVDGAVEETEDFSLSPGEDSKVFFTLQKEPGREHTVELGDLVETFRVLEPADFRASNLEVDPPSVYVGENVNISVFIGNSGGVEGTEEFSLSIGGQLVESKELELKSEESRDLSFSICMSENEFGFRFERNVYEVAVFGIEAPSKSEVEVIDPKRSPIEYSDYYYDVARECVHRVYNVPEEKNISGLANFLNQIKLPSYEVDCFDCSETTSIVEWLLEGAGFDAKCGLDNNHSWVLVDLSAKDTVAVETTFLTSPTYYYPPGIVEAPDGSFKEFSYITYYSEGHPGWYLSDDSDLQQELYNPEEVHDSPKTIIEGENIGGTHYYIPESEYDWWNVSPYEDEGPFSEWD